MRLLAAQRQLPLAQARQLPLHLVQRGAAAVYHRLPSGDDGAGGVHLLVQGLPLLLRLGDGQGFQAGAGGGDGLLEGNGRFPARRHLLLQRRDARLQTLCFLLPRGLLPLQKSLLLFHPVLIALRLRQPLRRLVLQPGQTAFLVLQPVGFGLFFVDGCLGGG